MTSTRIYPEGDPRPRLEAAAARIPQAAELAPIVHNGSVTIDDLAGWLEGLADRIAGDVARHNPAALRVRRAMSAMPFGAGLSIGTPSRPHRDDVPDPLDLDDVAGYLEALGARLKNHVEHDRRNEAELERFRRIRDAFADAAAMIAGASSPTHVEAELLGEVPA